MKFTNVILAASAASLACAYPRGRDVIPNKRSVSKRAANGFTCTSYFDHDPSWPFELREVRGWCQ